MKMYQWMIVTGMALCGVLLLSACSREVMKLEDTIDPEVWEKGYDLPIDQNEEKEAKEDCIKVLELIQEMYKNIGSEAISEEKTENLRRIGETLAQKGSPVIAGDSSLSAMLNYEKMDTFLMRASQGKACEELLYELHPDGSVSRKKYSFDGKDMYVLDCIGLWSKEKTSISMIAYARIKEWEYTERGWFLYELCVPEPPVLTEVMDGGVSIHVVPMNEEYRRLTERWLIPIGYGGNNLLRSEWDADHMEALDYNGLFEYLYFLRYRQHLDGSRYVNGIPMEEFESLMTAYLPVTPEELRQYAVFDEKTGLYAWAGNGCVNYSSRVFAISLPEITAIVENPDGTATWTVDIVCEILGNESVISHEITVRLGEEDGIQYLGNHILGEGLARIPEYIYRCTED